MTLTHHDKEKICEELGKLDAEELKKVLADDKSLSDWLREHHHCLWRKIICYPSKTGFFGEEFWGQFGNFWFTEQFGCCS